ISDYSQHESYHAVSDFVDANAARHGEKTVFADPSRTLTYGALQAASSRFARGLMNLGLRQESRVVLLMLDSVDYPIAFFGAMRAGIVPIPLNTLFTPAQYAYILGDSRAEAVVVSPALIKSIEPVLAQLPALRLAIVTGADATAPRCGGLETCRIDDVLARGASTDGAADSWTAQTVSDRGGFWLYSSGSTGDPKGAKHVHTSMIATARLYGEGVLGIKTDDVVFSAAKLFFAYGLGNSISFPMLAGASAVLFPDRPTPDAVLDV